MMPSHTTKLDLSMSDQEGQQEVEETKQEMKTWRAIIFGGTGVTGKELVQELINSPKWSRITLISRRHCEDFQSDKVEQVVVQMEQMEENVDRFQGHDVAFCTFGTTRKDAGSAQAFREIEHGYTVKFARLCKEHGVRHFHLLTAMGANPNSWLLYPQIKGMIEEEIKAMSFIRTTIWRPGLLARGDKSRMVEWLASYIISGLPPQTLAHAMRLQAERVLEHEEDAPEVELFIANKNIRDMARKE